MAEKYFITGGTGFIGRRLIEKLINEGKTIHLFGRESSDYSGLDNNPLIKIFKGSLLDINTINDAMKGADYVIHLAGYAKNWAKDISVYSRINIDGSLNIAEAALNNKIKKVIHVSTIVTLGATGKEIEDETHSVDPSDYFTEYERTKAAAEEKVLEYSKKGLDILAVNPTRVYGPGLISESNSLTLMIRNYMKFRNYLILGSGKSLASYIFVEDLVDGILSAIKNGRSGERYILGGENHSLKGFYQIIRKVTKIRAVPIYIPLLLALFIASTQEFMSKVFGVYPFITRPWVHHFLADWYYSNAKAKKELGFNPRTLEEGVKETVNWLKNQK
ncbi:MAG: NAD-dependent epimerase/dehydratase family protein [Acidobacteria bacterium]|nr:NAD-dependent epimerase/dehydratase family protein [Acidobacteriota bacterium]